MNQYDMNCPAAIKRLVEIGVPATIEHAVTVSGSAAQTNKTIAETVQVQLYAVVFNLFSTSSLLPLWIL